MEERQINSLLKPEAYPEPAKDVRLVQTHVSWIFLAGEFAFKIKKPVDFGFLDFSTLDRRRFYCHEEVRLNSRLCPEIYLGVTPVRETPDGAAFHGDGRVIDYAVKMRRLPEERMADRLLAEGRLTPDDVRKIALKVAEFHGRAERSAEIGNYGTLAAIERNWDENFRQAEEFAGVTIAPRDLQLLRDWARTFMAERSGLFNGRVAGGFIRECDGDLHLENICLTDRVCIFDCIEFNNRFRYTDTLADIAFLVMDLEYHGRRDLAELFLEEYKSVSKDVVESALVDFYRVYRAFVRGKVESFRLKDPSIPANEKMAAGERARRYFRLARGYIIREKLPAFLVVLCGLTGSGKSTVADALSLELGLEVISSDRLRKELAGIPLLQRTENEYGTGLYSTAQNESTYWQLVARADLLLSAGNGAIVDATCRRRRDRESLRSVAEKHGAHLLFVVVESPEDIVRKRLEERTARGTSISDGSWQVYLKQREEFEPVLAAERERLTVDTSAPLHDTVDDILTAMGVLQQTPAKPPQKKL